MSDHRSMRLLLTSGCMLLLLADGALAQRPRSGDPRAAPAARVMSADATAVLRTYRAALSQPGVRNASRTAVQRQLRARKPIAFVSGHWVTPIDLAAVYNDRTVKAAIAGALPAATAGRLGAIVQSPELRVGLAFTPMNFGDAFIGDMAGDLTNSVGVDALRNTMTGEAITVTAIVVAFAVGVASGVTANAFWAWWTAEETPVDSNTGYPIDHPNADPDGDGNPNWSDPDDDGDGAPDSEDQYPHDPNRTICMCTGRGGMAFGTRVTDQIMATVLGAYAGAGTASASTSLGAVSGTAFNLVLPAAIR